MSDDKNPTVESLAKALAEAQAVIADQKARLKTLGNGREDGMRALAATRAELDRVGRERDQLRNRLVRVEGMQTSTMALPEDGDAAFTPAGSATLPTIDELMADLSSIRESRGSTAGHLHLQVAAPAEDPLSVEMLAPALVFPEEYGAAAANSNAKNKATTRVLVLLDGAQPIKYPLYKDDMTIGRIDGADIMIDSHFISRMHARIIATAKGISIEDIESKNGIKVNGKLAKSHSLEHGDLVSLGGLRFRFLDTAAG
ncbi:MAG: FHA domain-containing protein [Gammaproteobacteria bacterium]